MIGLPNQWVRPKSAYDLILRAWGSACDLMVTQVRGATGLGFRPHAPPSSGNGPWVSLGQRVAMTPAWTPKLTSEALMASGQIVVPQGHRQQPEESSQQQAESGVVGHAAFLISPRRRAAVARLSRVGWYSMCPSLIR
jgi:hypothetical protein